MIFKSLILNSYKKNLSNKANWKSRPVVVNRANYCKFAILKASNLGTYQHNIVEVTPSPFPEGRSQKTFCSWGGGGGGRRMDITWNHTILT